MNSDSLQFCSSPWARCRLRPDPVGWSATAASIDVYNAICKDGTQKVVVEKTQRRAELYEVLGYKDLQQKLDPLFKKP